MKLASPWTRLVAVLVDSLLYSLAFFLGLLGVVASGNLEGVLNGLVNLALITVWFSAVWSLLVAWMTSQWGGSIGKLVCGVKVVGEDERGISFWRAVFRQLVKAVSGLLMGAGFWWILIDKERKGWHDQIAETKVVEKNRSGAWMGVIALVALVIAISWISGRGLGMLKQNYPLYQQIIEDLRNEFEKDMPRELPGDEYQVDMDELVV